METCGPFPPSNSLKATVSGVAWTLGTFGNVLITILRARVGVVCTNADRPKAPTQRGPRQRQEERSE
jgi:hypothetical protein